MDASATGESWRCPSCSAVCERRHCAVCGEKRPDPHDLSLGHLLAHAVESLTHVDGRFLATYRELLLRPGALSQAWRDGARRRAFAPFQTFLVANLIFFVVQSALHFQTLSNPLSSHIGEDGAASQFYSATGRRLLDTRLVATHRELADYRPVFDHAIQGNARALAILLVVGFTLVAVVAFGRRGRPFGLHVVFALHFTAVFLLLDTLLMPLYGIPLGWLLRRAGELPWWDSLFSPVMIGLLAAHWYLAARRMHGSRRPVAAVQTVLLVLALLPVLVGYRFLVFVFTLYTT